MVAAAAAAAVSEEVAQQRGVVSTDAVFALGPVMVDDEAEVEAELL